MNSQQAFELLTATAEQCHKAARAVQAITCLPDIETCELEALQTAVATELEDRNVDKKFRKFVDTHRMNHGHRRI